MSSERATTATAARMTVDPSGRGQGSSLAGLIDVLDRADSGAAAPAPRRRAGAHRPAGSRSRAVPLRSVRPAPNARPVAGPPVATPRQARPDAAPVSAPAIAGGLRGLARRAALWGAGPRGEYLAWPGAAMADAARPTLLTCLVRHVALWGAGPRGEYLAWPATPPPRSAVPVDADAPVVLREMPSTPTIRPAAPSPAAALVPRGPAVPVAARVIPPVPPAARVASAAPTSPARTGSPHPTGWPRPHAWPPSRPGATLSRSSSVSRAVPAPRSSGRSAAGPARARGDPSTCPVRGSPPPRWAPFAPG